MIKRFLVTGHILSLIILSCALVEEIKPPDEFLACLKVRMNKNDPSHSSYESLNNFCIASNRNKQTAKVEGPHLNISTDTVNWINELLRMSEVDIHERAKRQAVPGNDTFPIPPNLQFIFPSQFGMPFYPINSGTSDTTNQNQQAQPVVQNQQAQPVVQNQQAQPVQTAGNTQGQQTVIQPASVQQNPQIPAQIPIQGPQIPAQIPQGLQIPAQGQGLQIPVQGPQIPFEPQQVVAQSAQVPVQMAGDQQFLMPPQQQQFTAQAQVAMPQRRQLRVRKEYRRLTDQERGRYHRAILMLKADTSVQPNRYDALGLIHFRMVDNIHHGGAFLAWHRIFITIYENALRQKVPDVTLPYFDSTMDEAMVDPTRSILFDPAFLGNGNGLVTTGSFAYWQTPSGPLIRNIGNAGGSLFSKNEIRTILSRTRNAEILEPGASNTFNIENIHGDVHTWLGGQMEPMETSAFDPIFYMHHAFVDYVWEIFRSNQRRVGIDPTQDYPQNYGRETHAPFTRTGFGNVVNGFGFSDMFTAEVYTYEPNPSCSFNNPSCGSNYLTCDISTGVPTCIPIAVGGPRPIGPLAPMGFGAAVGPMLPGFMPNAFVVGRKKRNVEKVQTMKSKRQVPTKTPTTKLASPFSPAAEVQTCTTPDLSYSSQNTFEIEGKADTRSWVFLPVRIVSKRTPENQKFHAFPIYDGVAAREFDIYNPESYPEISPYFEDEMMPQSERCIKSVGSSQTVGRIHIRSDGLNYRGTYDEYVIVDLRQAFVEATTYVGLRNPEKEYSEVIISAYDSCGRKCRAFCRNENGDTSQFHECAGSIRATHQQPYGYGINYGDAVQLSWDIKNATFIPEFKSESVFIQFFCDHLEY